MKPKQPLPTERPFITFMTCTYRRPKALAENMKSIARQTLAKEIEQIIIPDYVGVAPNDAVYGRLPWYVDAPRGEYVHVLGDDDVLVDDRAVERLKQFIERNGNPSVVVLKCKKGDQVYPKRGGYIGDLQEGDIDLCNLVISREAWRDAMTTYAKHYECDYGFWTELRMRVDSNAQYAPLDMLFAQGAVGGGRPEAVDW